MTPTEQLLREIKSRLDAAYRLRKEHNENIGQRQDGPQFDPRAAQAELAVLNNAHSDLAKLIEIVEVLREALDKVWDTPCEVNSKVYFLAVIAEDALAKADAIAGKEGDE